MFKLAVVLVAVVGAVVAQHESYGHDEHQDYHSPPHYKFEYSVHDSKTHDIKKQGEERKDDRVKGYYSLKEADGTTREVHYSSDKHNGFSAHVQRSGHAQHPAHYGSSGESYHHGGSEQGHGHGHGGAVSSSSFSGHL